MHYQPPTVETYGRVEELTSIVDGVYGKEET